MASRGKALIRSLNRRGSASSRPRGTAVPRTVGEPTVCERCSALFVRRAWRRVPLRPALLQRARWTICPACRQVERQEWVGRVLARGVFPAARARQIEQRIRNVARQATAMQPLRRLVSIDRSDDGFEVLVTSQKLAHRIVHELKKTFGGRARYVWADDGSLVASWTCDRPTRPQ